MNRKIKWYCYVCGKKVSKEFFLFSLNDSVDRVFLCCSGKYCKNRLGKDALIIKVKRIIKFK